MARFDQHARFDSAVRFDEATPTPATPRNRMARVKLDLNPQKPLEVLGASSTHIASMATPEGMAAYPTPEPTVADFLVTHNGLSAAINLVTSLEGQLSAARAALPVAVEAHMVNMRARATYVEEASGGDPAKIPLSGFAVAGTPGTPIGPLPRPENVRASMGQFPGVIRVSCDPIKGTQTYVTECRLHDEPNQTWQQAKLSTKSRNDINGLVSGKNYAFRMAAIGAAGQSPWSDEAVCMAP